MQDDNIETHQSPRYWDSWEIGHSFRIAWAGKYCDHYVIVTVLGPNCVWGVK